MVASDLGAGGKILNIRDRVKEFRRVPASELRPNPKNWRTHPKSQQDALRGLLAEVGFAGAELARELPDGSLMLIDGHARAEIMGSNEVPVLILDVSESEADKILATYDPIGAMAGADRESLDVLLREVQTESQDVAKMLEELGRKAGCDWANENDVQEDDLPHPSAELLEKWNCKLGQSWSVIGKQNLHRIIIGDATSVTGVRADGICTDPPYDLSPEIVIAAFGMVADCAVVVGSGKLCIELAKRWEYRLDFSWKHRQPRSFPTPHQPVLYHHWVIVLAKDAKVKTGWTRPNSGWASVIECEREFEDSEMGHGKSAELCVKMMEGFPHWKTVCDPFLGSGTTLIACEESGRTCIGIELQPMHAAVALERAERFGLTPQLESVESEIS